MADQQDDGQGSQRASCQGPASNHKKQPQNQAFRCQALSEIQGWCRSQDAAASRQRTAGPTMPDPAGQASSRTAKKGKNRSGRPRRRGNSCNRVGQNRIDLAVSGQQRLPSKNRHACCVVLIDVGCSLPEIHQVARPKTKPVVLLAHQRANVRPITADEQARGVVGIGKYDNEQSVRRIAQELQTSVAWECDRDLPQILRCATAVPIASVVGDRKWTAAATARARDSRSPRIGCRIPCRPQGAAGVLGSPKKGVRFE
jgi:hypothetical protein